MPSEALLMKMAEIPAAFVTPKKRSSAVSLLLELSAKPLTVVVNRSVPVGPKAEKVTGVAGPPSGRREATAAFSLAEPKTRCNPQPEGTIPSCAEHGQTDIRRGAALPADRRRCLPCPDHNIQGTAHANLLRNRALATPFSNTQAIFSLPDGDRRVARCSDPGAGGRSQCQARFFEPFDQPVPERP